MSSTMCGMPIMRSMSHVTTASAFLPPSAATAPMTRAITDDTVAASNPTSTLVDRPAKVRSSMSRPIQSVPKGCASEGPRFFCAKSVAVAASVASTPATTTAASAATANTMAASVSLRLPTRALRGRCRTFAQSSSNEGTRGGKAPEACSRTLRLTASRPGMGPRLPLAAADAGVHHAVQHVRNQVAAEHERRRQHGDARQAAPRRRRGRP